MLYNPSCILSKFGCMHGHAFTVTHAGYASLLIMNIPFMYVQHKSHSQSTVYMQRPLPYLFYSSTKYNCYFLLPILLLSVLATEQWKIFGLSCHT